jgi:hypothetical protein
VTPVNDAPAGANNTVTTYEDTDYTSSAPVTSASAIRTTARPTASCGQDHHASRPGHADRTTVVAVGRAVRERRRHHRGQARSSPGANANGAGYASFTFQVRDDGGIANGGVNLDQSAQHDDDRRDVRERRAGGHQQHGHHHEDTDYTLHAGDFGFSDPNDSPANTSLAVKITTLPGSGHV